MTSSYKEYRQRKDNFFQKHGAWEVETSPMVNDSYSKTYVFSKGAVWYEHMYPCTKTAKVVVDEFTTWEEEKKLFAVEYYSNEDSVSRIYYEKW